jgi:hypothetical protein
LDIRACNFGGGSQAVNSRVTILTLQVSQSASVQVLQPEPHYLTPLQQHSLQQQPAL